LYVEINRVDGNRVQPRFFTQLNDCSVCKSVCSPSIRLRDRESFRDGTLVTRHPKIYRCVYGDTIGRYELFKRNKFVSRSASRDLISALPVTKRAGRRAVHAVPKSRLPFLNAQNVSGG